MFNPIRLAVCILLTALLVCPTPASDDLLKPASHRAFRPIQPPTIPVVRGNARTSIDRFILAGLEANGHSIQLPADRATLIRRVCFDLTGLPPTLADIDAFLSDRSPDAFERMIERYLASPNYGERWGKFWLDAAGYADSNGYFNADSDRPLAWRYRDYIVRNFNADRPYDEFVREQIAGDELVGFRPGGDVTPAMVDALIATHFLRNAPDGTGESDGNPDEVLTDRMTVLEGNVQNLMNCLLGLTVQCARCHDHKFEPMSQKEYYSLQAILFPVYNPQRWSKPNDRVVQVGTQAELAAHKQRNDRIDRQIKTAQAGLTAFADGLREEILAERLKGVDEATRSAVLVAAGTQKQKRTKAQSELLRKYGKVAEVKEEELAKRFPEFAAFRDQVKRTIAAREQARPQVPEKLAAFFETDFKPPAHHLLKRGVHTRPGEVVQPGVLDAISTAKNRFRIETPPSGRVSTGRRTALAKWITSPENPLFARVLVNRIWQHHFGTGIVSTPDNLGMSGAKASHPELLDHLAWEFMRSGWSIKSLHRLILRSAVYQQSCAQQDGLEAIDPDNRLLSHFPIRRLDAEAIRDAMLYVSDELDSRAGGRYVPSKRTPEGIVEIVEAADGAHKRSIYLQQRRTQVVTFLQLFDSPSIVTTCGKRSPSTVPLQSLALLNSDFARARSRAFASRLVREGGDDSSRVNLAFRLACGRRPLDPERVLCEKFLAKQRAAFKGVKDGDARVWADLCQMIFASNAFLYVE